MGKHQVQVDPNDYPAPNIPRLLKKRLRSVYYELDEYRKKLNALKIRGVDLIPIIKEILRYKLRPNTDLPSEYHESFSPSGITAWLDKTGKLKLEFQENGELILKDIHIQHDPIKAYDHAMSGI